jgi:hypothetical protein
MLTSPAVCPDPVIARNSPMMVERILHILAESRSIWPLASRWYDLLERFYKSHNSMTAGAEGSMADSVSTLGPPARRSLVLSDLTLFF